MSFLDDYEPVEARLEKFWAEHPDGQITTELVPAPDGQWIVKASVWREALRVVVMTYYAEPGNSDQVAAFGTPDATGYAHEHVTEKGVNSTSALENCETSAIGRALANLGYAAKGKRPSREEMVKVKESGEPTRPDYAIWLADQVPIFKGWDEEGRKLAYASAIKRAGLESMGSMDDARRVFVEMEGLYAERPLQDEGLPLETDE